MADNNTTKRWYEILALLTPFIVGVGVTGAGAFFTYVNNARQAQLNQITVLDKFRPLLLSETESEREFAYAAFAAIGYEGLALKIIQTKQDPAGRALAEQVKQSSSSADQSVAETILATTPPRVYIQITNEAQRSAAMQLAESLTAARYSVQGIENVSAKAKAGSKTSVRYFNQEDQNAANYIVEALKTQGDSTAVAQIVTRYKVRPGSIEVWFRDL